MNVTTKLKIDLQKKSLQPEIDAVQGDTYSRQLELSLYTGVTPWIIPDDTLIAVRYCKEDGTHGYYDTLPDGTSAWSFHENIVTVQLAPQMLTAPGRVLTQVELLQKDTVLATFGLKIRVEANAAAGVLRSETYVNWLKWMEQQLSDQVESGGLRGPQGPAGPAARIVSYVTEFQSSDSGTTVPTGSWTRQIPQVSQGQYLWTRTTQTYNSGDTVEIYTLSRFGIDGSGSVSSVNNMSPDKIGNVALSAANVGALDLRGGTMEGTINMNGQKLSGLNVPAEETEAATKGYVDSGSKNVKNYAAGLRVQNLLDNSDFTNLVNQNGATSGQVTFGHIIDRWIVGSADGSTNPVPYEVSTAGLTVGVNQVGYGSLRQRIDTVPAGKIMTAFAMTDNGELISGLVEDYMTSLGFYQIVFVVNKETTFRWACLYEGIYTAENLPPYVSKGYAVELLECQRYFQRFATQNLIPSSHDPDDFRPTMRRPTANNGLVTIGTITVGEKTYYTASADL